MLTVQQFYELNPNLKFLKGEQLWNAMEEYMVDHPEYMGGCEVDALPKGYPLESFGFAVLSISEPSKPLPY